MSALAVPAGDRRMGFSWQIMERGAEEAWREVAANCRYATFFHTKPWADLFCQTFRSWRPDPVVIEFSDGNVMVLPMLRRLHFGHRESMVPHVYGGPLFVRPPEEHHWEAVEKVPRWFSDITLVGNPFAPYNWEQDGLVRWRLWTHATDLTPGFDALWKRFRQRQRRCVKAGQKAGVTVSVAGTRAEIDAYYEVYEDSLRRWGKTAAGFYPRGLFHNLFLMPEFGKTVRLWLASLNGRVIGGILMFYHQEHAVYWHGCSHSAYLHAHPSPLLLVTAMEAACTEGFRWFDFNPSGHLKRVEEFKEDFATERLKFNAYYSQSVIGGLFQGYRSFKERFLRSCPL